MNTARQAFGRWGEEQAARFLIQQGYTLLERNVRTPFGELDLVFWQPGGDGAAGSGAVVFVEVKTRSSTTFGLPEEAVTSRKQAHLLGAAQAYLQAHPELDGAWRVDVIAVQRARPGQAAVITHFEDALR